MEGLKKSAASGAKWTAASALVSAALQVAQLVVLARLLGPAEFGLVAMAMIVVALMQTFVDFGISSALVWRQDATDDQMASLYALGLALGAAGFAVALAATPVCVWFFQERALEAIIPWCAAVLLIGPVGQQFAALLQRELHFRALATAEIISQMAGFAAAVCLAWRGAGALALVWALLVSVAVRSVLLVRAGLPVWRPRLHFRVADLRGFARFGLFQTMSGFLNFALMRMDQLLLGRLLGVAALGHYNFAYNIAMQPLTRINPVLMRVAFPVFARVQGDDEKLRRGFFFVCRALLTVNAPLLAGLAVAMPWMIGTVFQPKWSESVVLVQLLAAVALFRSAGNPAGALLLAKGRADLEFKWNVFVVATQVVAVVLGARWGGAAGVALGLLASQLVFLATMYGWLIRPNLGPCLPAFLSSLAKPVAPALAMTGVVLVVAWLCAGLPRSAVLVLVVASGAAVYASCLAVFQRDFVREVLELLRSR